MIACTVSGNLTTDAEVAFESKSGMGKVYKLRLASNRSIYKNEQFEDRVTWISGLITEKKLGNRLKFLKKGKGVIAVSSQAEVTKYLSRSGQPEASLELNYLDRIELIGGVNKNQTETPQKFSNLQEAMKHHNTVSDSEDTIL